MKISKCCPRCGKPASRVLSENTGDAYWVHYICKRPTAPPWAIEDWDRLHKEQASVTSNVT